MEKIREQDTIDRFLKTAKEMGLDISKKELDEALRDDSLYIALDYKAQYLVDAFTEFIEREARRKSGIDSLKVRMYQYGEYGEDGVLVATVPVKIGGKRREIIVYNEEVMNGYKLADDINDFKEALESISDEIARESKKVVSTLKKMSEAYKVVNKGIGSDSKLVMITIDLSGEVRETLPAIVPKNMKESMVEKIVKDTVKELDQKQGVWSTADLYEILEKRYKIRFLPIYEDWGVEVV